jgi:hypothetical protein
LIPILIGALVAALIGLKAGFSWEEIEYMDDASTESPSSDQETQT